MGKPSHSPKPIDPRRAALDRQQVAEFLRVSLRTLEKWVAAKHVPPPAYCDEQGRGLYSLRQVVNLLGSLRRKGLFPKPLKVTTYSVDGPVEFVELPVEEVDLPVEDAGEPEDYVDVLLDADERAFEVDADGNVIGPWPPVARLTLNAARPYLARAAAAEEAGDQ